MVCKCDSGASNTGFDCTNLGGQTRLSFLMNKTKKDGSPNGIDFATDATDGVIPASVIEAKINDPIPEDRWFPVGKFENVEDVRAEIVVQTFNSGNSAKIKDGIRTFSAVLIKMAPNYVETLESFGCQKDVAVMHVDLEGSLIGESLDGNFLRPIKIDSNTISAILVKTSDTEVSYITFSYAYAQTTQDGNLSMITADGFGIDLTNVRGLLEGQIALANVQETSLVANVSVVYGNVINGGLKVEDLVLADFEILNLTQGSTVTIDSINNALAVNGTYTLNYSSGVAVSDELSVGVNKTGYSFKNAKSGVV
tara:strand:+ start:67 stop:996 length:930 start_codon:yes stop_codon:yes gene_type:complete